MKMILKFILLLVLMALIYVVGTIIYGTITDFDPKEQTEVKFVGNADSNIDIDSITLFIWNIGYAGLGKESDFFFDGGNMVRSKKEWVEKNFEGIKNTIQQWNKADFILLQEVEIASRRSYNIKEFDELSKLMPEHNVGIGINYDVKYIPIPLLNPMGKVKSGIMSLSKAKPIQSTRYSFPGNFSWPKRIFFLDRCFLLTRYSLSNGKELVVINTHNSAYDDGSLKKQQMDYLKSYLLGEYEKGNYVIVGGDWNQCPPEFGNCTEGLEVSGIENYHQSNIDSNYIGLNWKWVYDIDVATNRKLVRPYDPNKTFTTIIDFYLVSPNIQVKQVEGVEMNFEYSDHQPVKMVVKLL